MGTVTSSNPRAVRYPQTSSKGVGHSLHFCALKCFAFAKDCVAPQRELSPRPGVCPRSFNVFVSARSLNLLSIAGSMTYERYMIQITSSRDCYRSRPCTWSSARGVLTFGQLFKLPHHCSLPSAHFLVLGPAGSEPVDTPPRTGCARQRCKL